MAYDYGTGSLGAEQRLYGTIDPTVVGLVATVGTLFRRNDVGGGNFQVYIKTGPNPTDWERLARTSEVATMIGNAVLNDITFAAGQGPVVRDTLNGHTYRLTTTAGLMVLAQLT